MSSPSSASAGGASTPAGPATPSGSTMSSGSTTPSGSTVPTAAGVASGVIVVGVDGSDGSRDALTWATRQAMLTGAPVRAVGTWRWPSYVTRVPPGVDLAGETTAVVAQQVAEVLQQMPNLVVEQRVVEGPPGPALASLAHDAALLVVGASGRAAFPGMLLGSVAEYCVRQANCPVVVVRPGAIG